MLTKSVVSTLTPKNKAPYELIDVTILNETPKLNLVQFKGVDYEVTVDETYFRAKNAKEWRKLPL